MASNPVVPCFGRLHAPAGGFAAAVLAVFVFAMPVLTFLLIWWDPWLAGELRKRRQMKTASGDQATTAGSHAPSTSSDLSHPAHAGQESPPPRRNPFLFPFQGGGDYSEEAWFWRHVDLVVVFGLSATNALLPTPDSLVDIVAKLVVALTLLGTLVVLLVVLQKVLILVDFIFDRGDL
jgi:hypothetical protein